MYHDFKNFLLEKKDSKEKPEEKSSNQTLPHKKPEKYLSHLEDAIVNGGHEGVNLVANYLDDAHNLLTGHKAKADYQVKYDGQQITFGIDPETQQFFIATKSAPHEKNDKVSHSKEDIKKNHKGKDGDILTIAFYHLPKILPKNMKPGESYSGDIMHTSKDITTKNKHIHFKPNSITYSAPSDSPHGAKAKKSKIGIVVHTKHENGSSIPIDKKERKKFIDHPDVHNIDPTLEVDPKNYTPDNMKEFFKHRDAASKLYKSMQPESFDASMEHAQDLHKYIHQSLSTTNNEHKNGQLSANSFISHIGNSFKDSLESSKTDKNKKEKTSKHSDKATKVHGHSAHIEKSLQLHNHLMKAKDVLFHAMCKSIPWIHSLEGMPISPEGIIAFSPDGSAVKFVDRTAYSKSNKNKG